MVTSFVRRAELVDPEITGARFHKEQQEADKTVRDTQPDLFPGAFFNGGPQAPRRLPDPADGVLRCARCHWEVSYPHLVDGQGGR
jgi:hypothetical protein